MKNKIMEQGFKMAFCLALVTASRHTVAAQDLPRSSFGLPIVDGIALYRQTILHHPEKKMVPVRPEPGLVLDLRYATKNNITASRLYPAGTATTHLRQPVFGALEEVLGDLKKAGLGLIIFDAYRPYAVTVALWKKMPDDRYAANPATGSGHNRGIAVDLTLMDLATGKALAMPTGFDSFSDSAHQDFMALDTTILKHRGMLKTVMEKHGFIALPTEWWHFSWPHPEQFDVLDLGFEALKAAEEH